MFAKLLASDWWGRIHTAARSGSRAALRDSYGAFSFHNYEYPGEPANRELNAGFGCMSSVVLILSKPLFSPKIKVLTARSEPSEEEGILQQFSCEMISNLSICSSTPPPLPIFYMGHTWKNGSHVFSSVGKTGTV